MAWTATSLTLHSDKLKVLSKSLANSSAKVEKRIMENRLQKEESLIFRVTKTNEVSGIEKIETEKLLAQLVETEMNRRLKEDTYKGKKFNAFCHFLGYQARGALPAKFDCDYAYASPSPAHLIKNID
ncbi:Pyrophosphate--fructose 6-phosphate 1-phosphotransferase subunit alpha 1 [Zea mays]|uniref:Pyrophosphate--fructose 6-phosphate 1-phosphotransferase subunit alpha 2 n=2 Tax=Zea mays TaxID=4577 RepID=A0A1D6LP84_MAIZE|nr:Pyrophosphate--fructose 6-phosphate 1-phosphotransferase subunit alpha 2 [Zea mays]PWZ18022.1 Pyrophosphate--fructose 6-phosphate 1-phosphotransferase subunit alpha 1 [Zea mays]